MCHSDIKVGRSFREHLVQYFANMETEATDPLDSTVPSLEVSFTGIFTDIRESASSQIDTPRKQSSVFGGIDSAWGTHTALRGNNKEGTAMAATVD